MKFKSERAEYLFSYLKDMIKENDWNDEYTRNWARSFVTTICIIENIDVDTSQWDNMITEIYDTCIAGCDTYCWTFIKFDIFMCEYLA